MAFKLVTTTTGTNSSPKPLQRARTAAAALLITVAVPTLVVGGLPTAVNWSVNQGPFLEAVLFKSIGRDEPCPWGKLLRYPWAVARFIRLQEEYSRRLSILEEDGFLPIDKFASPTRPFWIKRGGTLLTG